MKKASLFYKIYFSVIALFIIALIAGLFVFNGWLKSYEAGQPEQVVDKFITEHIKKTDLFAIRKDIGLKISDYETKDNVDNTVKTVTNGKKIVSSTSAKRPKDCDIAYTVKADDNKIINLYLKKSGKKYVISSSEFDASLYKSIKITSTSDADISVNGIALKDSDRKNEKLPNLKNDLIKSAKIINKQIFTLDNFLNIPKSVTAKSGSKELEVSANGNSYAIVQDFTEKDKIADFAGKAGTACAVYMQNDGSLGTVKKYCDNDTDFYKNLKSSLVIFVLDHDGYTIKDLKVSEQHKYSDTLFSCRVAFTNELKKGTSKYQDFFDKYVYLRKDNDTYKVIDMQNVS